MKRRTKSQKLVSSSFHEVTHNPPKILGRTRRKFGAEAARKQRIAIALSKARRAGARLPKRSA